MNKLISKYKRRIKKTEEDIEFYNFSYNKNLNANRLTTARELKFKVEKLEYKIKIYKLVIDDLKFIE